MIHLDISLRRDSKHICVFADLGYFARNQPWQVNKRLLRRDAKVRKNEEHFALISNPSYESTR